MIVLVPVQGIICKVFFSVEVGQFIDEYDWAWAFGVAVLNWRMMPIHAKNANNVIKKGKCLVIKNFLI